MTRDELLDHLRRELSNREWSELRPEARLSEVEYRVDKLVESLEDIRTDYDETTGEDLLQALDDLAAALSYFRSDLGHAFSVTTRLTNELRDALRRLDSDTDETQMRIGLSDDAAEEAEAPQSGELNEEPTQTSLFGD